MKRLAMFVLFVACPVFAQQPTLDLKGDGVKIVTVVDKFPVTLTAPAGGLMRQWQVPAGVMFVDNGASIEIKDAAVGETTIGCRYIVIDWDAKKADERLLRVTFTVGGLAPPPDPVDPEAIPSAALRKAMQDAYDADPDPRKKDHVARLARHLGGIVKGLKTIGIETDTDFDAKVHGSTSVALTDGDLPKGNGDLALPAVRPAVGAFVQTRLPRRPGETVEETFWKAASIAYSQVAQALKAVK